MTIKKSLYIITNIYPIEGINENGKFVQNNAEALSSFYENVTVIYVGGKKIFLSNIRNSLKNILGTKRSSNSKIKLVNFYDFSFKYASCVQLLKAIIYIFLLFDKSFNESSQFICYFPINLRLIPNHILNNFPVFCHVGDSTLPFFGPSIVQKLNKVSIIGCVNNSYVKAFAMQGVKTSHIEVVPNGVNIESTSPQLYSDRSTLEIIDHLNTLSLANTLAPQKKTIIFVGHLINRKHPEVFYSLASELGREYNFLLVGEGPLIPENNLTNLTKISYLPNNSLRIIMKNSYLLLHPSGKEGMANVLLEACAEGLPIICQNLPFNSSWLRGPLISQYCLIDSIFDIDVLCRSALAILTSDTIWSDLSRDLYTISTQYSLNLRARSIVHLLNN